MNAYNVSLSNRCKKFLVYREFKDWLEDCRVFLSPQTFLYYGDVLADFFLLLGLTPDKVVKVKSDVATKLIRKYCMLKLQQGVSKVFVVRNVDVLKSFFRFHGVEVKGKLPIRRENKFYDKIPTREELSKILVSCKSLSTKIAIHFLAYAGLRLEDLCNLTYRSIKKDFEKGLVPCSVFVPQAKTGDFYVTFIPSSTVKLLREYFNFRRERYGEKITDKSPILLDHHTAPKKIFKGIRRKTLTNKLEKVFKKSGITLKEDWGNKVRRLRPYSLRKYFRSKLTGNVPTEILESWMGHTNGLAQVYSGQKDLDPEIIEKMREIYKQNVENFVVEEIELAKLSKVEGDVKILKKAFSLLFVGKQKEAEKMIMEHFNSTKE